MLNSLLAGEGGGGGGGGVEPIIVELVSNVAVENVSGSRGDEQLFKIAVPDNASSLVVSIEGGFGDADLYVRRGDSPNLSEFDCRPFLAGNGESCEFVDPSAGEYFVMLRGFSDYTGVRLLAEIEAIDPSPCPSCEKFTGNLSGPGDIDNHPNGEFYESPAGNHKVLLKGPEGTDFDVYLYQWFNGRWAPVASSIGTTSDEEINFQGTSGFYHVRVVSYRGSGDYELYLETP